MDAASCLLLVVASTSPLTPQTAQLPTQQPAPTAPAAIQAGGGNLHAPSALPWDDVLRVRSFDPTLGTLAAVRITVDGYARADMRMENLGEAPCFVHAQSLVLVTLGTESGTPFAHLPFESEVVWVPQSFDGTVDFEGASGRRRVAVARRNAQVVIDDPARLVDFLDPDGVVELPVSAVGSSAFVGGGTMAEHVGLDAGVRVQVEYLVAGPSGS